MSSIAIYKTLSNRTLIHAVVFVIVVVPPTILPDEDLSYTGAKPR